MKIIPSIDLYDGKCVRLTEGKKEHMKFYDIDILEYCKKLESCGVEYLHIVDLNGALSNETSKSTTETIQKIINNTSLKVDVGGGIRSIEKFKDIYNMNVDSIVFGTIAYTNPLFVFDCIGEFENFNKEQIIIACDTLDENIVVKGWEQKTPQNILDFISTWVKEGFNKFLCTDVSKDGTLTGPSFKLYKKILKTYPDIQLIASGGVNSIHDLNRLKETGLSYTIIGKALFEGKITFNELETWIKNC